MKSYVEAFNIFRVSFGKRRSKFFFKNTIEKLFINREEVEEYNLKSFKNSSQKKKKESKTDEFSARYSQEIFSKIVVSLPHRRFMKVRLSSFLKKIPSCLIHNVIFTSVRGRDERGGNGEVVGNRKRPSSLPLQLVKPWNLDGDSRFVFPGGRKCWPLITIMKGVMGRSRDREKNTLAPYWSNLSPALDIRSPNPFRKMSRSTFIVHQPLPYSSVPLVNERKKKKQILLANVCNHTLTLITPPTAVPL